MTLRSSGAEVLKVHSSDLEALEVFIHEVERSKTLSPVSAKSLAMSDLPTEDDSISYAWLETYGQLGSDTIADVASSSKFVNLCEFRQA